MQHSIWKLAALVGISGFGFLGLLQVQKNLHDRGTVEAAEAAGETPARKVGVARVVSKSTAPGRVRIQQSAPVVADSLGAAAPASAALDSVAEGQLVRSAEAELKPIPQASPAADRDTKNPFASLDERKLAERTTVVKKAAPPQDEPKPVITPAGFESASKEPAAPVQPPADAPADFGQDPFAAFGDLSPDPAASGLEERPEPMPTASPSELLDANDPFSAAPATTDEPSSATDASDDPFGASPAASEPVAAEPATPEAATAEPATPERVPTRPVLDFGDPFGDEPAEPADRTSAVEPQSAPEQAEAEPSLEPSPEPIPESPVEATEPAMSDEPATSDDAFGADPFGPDPFAADPMIPAAPADQPSPATSPTSDFDFREGDSVPLPPVGGSEFDETPTEPEPRPEPETRPVPESRSRPDISEPLDHSPRRLPESDMGGIGTVSPTDPQGPQHAELTVEKKAPEKAVLGQPLVYEIIVTNVGDSPAHEVTVSDAVPKGMELGGTSPRAELAGKMLVWKLDTLAPGQSTTIKVKATPIEAGMLGSVATVNFVSEVAARTEVIAAHLTLKLDAPTQVAIGQPVDLHFEIGNDGNAPAEKVMLRNVLPVGFQHSDGNDLEYEVGELPPGKSESVTLRVAAVQPGSFKNTAVLTATGGLKSEAVAAIEVSNQKVTVTRQGPKRRFVGRPATYANTVKNASQEIVTGVKVIEQVPPGLEFVEASHGGQFDVDRRIVAWQVGSMRPGQEQTLQVVLTAAEEGVQDSVVRVEEAEGGQVEVASATAVSALPSLAPTLQTPTGPIIVGERSAMQIRVKNRGAAEATAVTVSLALPPQLRLVEVRGGPVNTTANGKNVVEFATAVPAGGEQMVEFIVEGVAAGPAPLRAEVNASHMPKPLVKDEQLVVNPRR